MSIKIVGSFAYRTNKDNEIKNVENNQIKQTKDLKKFLHHNIKKIQQSIYLNLL